MYVHGGQETGGLLTERYTFVDEVAPTSPETSFLFGGGGLWHFYWCAPFCDMFYSSILTANGM